MDESTSEGSHYFVMTYGRFLCGLNCVNNLFIDDNIFIDIIAMNDAIKHLDSKEGHTYHGEIDKGKLSPHCINFLIRMRTPYESRHLKLVYKNMLFYFV